MINERVRKVINEQINKELYSSYLYLSMSAYFENKNLKGFANWTRVQALEESAHGLKFYDYLNNRGGKVELAPIEGPKTNWNSILEIFEEIYEHEQKVTALINNIAHVAFEERDFATQSYIQWFVNEQVEEESNASGLIEQLKLIGDNSSGIFMLDKELGTRVFLPPPPYATNGGAAGL